MRILHVVQHFCAGGLEKFVWNLSLAQKDLGHEVALFVYDEQRDWAPLLERLGVKVYLPPKKKNGFDIELIFRLDQVSSNYDIVHSHDIGPLIYCGFVSALKKIRCDKQIFMHSVHGLVHKNNKRYHLYETIFTKAMDQVIAVSPEIYHYYDEKMRIPKKRLKMLYNGVEVDPLRTIYHSNLHQNERNYLRKKYNIATDKKIIIHVARIFPLKDQMTLVKAMNHLPHHELLIVGPIQDFTYGEKLKEIAGPRVHFVGSINNVEEYLLGSDIYASASTEEGLSISVLEAMAAGLPVLLSDIEGHRILTNNGEVGTHFKLGDSEDFALKVVHLKDGHLGFDYVQENYSLEEVAGKYLKLYQR
ncbi:MAG: glycosyltransferase family 4 protein [Bacteriovoracaceae bacterium]